VVGLVAALIWELTREDPIVDIRLLKDRNFFLATLTMFVLGFVLYGSTALLPIFLQTLLGYTALLSGLVLSPGGIVVIIMLPVVGKLLNWFQARWLVIVGALIVALSLFHMATFNLDIDFHTAMTARIYQSAGMAFLFVPTNVMAFYFIPKVKFNNATGLINLARNIGGSFGIANVVTLLARRSQFHQTMLVSHMTPLDAPLQAMMRGSTQLLSAAGSNSADAVTQANGMAYGLAPAPCHHARFRGRLLDDGRDVSGFDPTHVLDEEKPPAPGACGGKLIGSCTDQPCSPKGNNIISRR